MRIFILCSLFFSLVSVNHKANAQTSPLSYPPSGRADFEYIDYANGKLKTTIYSDQAPTPEGSLCKAFLDELENGKTDLIVGIPVSEMNKHQLLRGCIRGNRTGNALMVVVRSSVSMVRKLEIFKLLVSTYHFPTSLVSHGVGDPYDNPLPLGDYSVMNMIVGSDEFYPLTEFLTAQNSKSTMISYPFGYNNGPSGDWCTVPLIMQTINEPHLGAHYPTYYARDIFPIRTFKLLNERNYARNQQTGEWNCTGQNQYESFLEYIKRIKKNPYLNVKNLDEAIQILESQQ